MKIIVTSDIHKNESNLAKVILKESPYDYYLDAGDSLLNPNKFINLNGRTVKGNCDYEDYEKDLILSYGNYKILLTHGDKYGVKLSLKSLLKQANILEVNLVIFGHTHDQILTRFGNVTLLNPGSLGYNNEYAIIDDKGVKLCKI